MRWLLALILATTAHASPPSGFEGTWQTVWTDAKGGLYATEVVLDADGQGLWGTEAGVDGLMVAQLSADGTRLSGRWGVRPDDTSSGTFILELRGADVFAGCWMLAGDPSRPPMVWMGARNGATPLEPVEANIPAACLPGV
jgi:hypothetical protein